MILTSLLPDTACASSSIQSIVKQHSSTNSTLVHVLSS